MLSALSLFAVVCLQQPQFSFVPLEPYEPGVPRPEAMLGYGPGERHTTFRDQEQVLLAIAAAAPDRVKVVEYGKSAEGRPLRIFVVSTPENMARLDAFRANWRRLAEGEPGAEKLIAETPALVWINHAIHGDESASPESVMWLLYNLAASQERGLRETLSDAVVVLNPMYNPDGHERFVVWYNSIAVHTPEPEAFEHSQPRLIHGRTNRYRFDMNRDRLAMSQPETRQEVAEFLRWMPHVYVDQHGQTTNYFFPPNPMAVNPNVDRERLNRWADVFGRANASAFDRQGWLYFIRDTYDFFAPGYLDTWATLSGAIGMTYETDAGRYHSLRQADGHIKTLRGGMEKHFLTALTSINTAATHRRQLLESYHRFRHGAATGRVAGNFQRVVAVSDDARELERLRQKLALSGIRSAYAAQPFTQRDANDYWSSGRGAIEFPAGSLIIDMAQPQGMLAKAILEPETEFEPEFVREQLERRTRVPEQERYPGPERMEFYDTTAWSLIYAHNVKGWWCESAPPVPVAEKSPQARPPLAEGGQAGWLLEYSDQNDILAVADLARADVRVHVLPKPMRIQGRQHERGTFVVTRGRNDFDPSEIVAEVARKRGVRFLPIESGYPDEGRVGPGSADARYVRKPHIAVVFGEGMTTTSFGPLWWLMEHEFDLPFTPIRTSALNGDLSKFTCIVFPYGTHSPPSERLRTWVRDGGTIVAFESIDWAIGERGFFKLEEVPSRGNQPASLPGAIFRGLLDTRYFLSYGYRDLIPNQPEPTQTNPNQPEPIRTNPNQPTPPDPLAHTRITIAVPVEGRTFYRSRQEGGGAITLAAEADGKALAGWLWPNDTEKNLAGTVWLHEEPFGRGHVVLFSQDPASRAMWPGLYKLILNAMILGPR
jgi:hypothetical protein